ncbi:glycosyltransferase [Candidatus Babeliales bacterium]|nr:glycosyltransferase [Candidatus Babeliales bacterium]
MKVLHLITSLKIGGAESALVNLLKKFKEENKNNHFIAHFYNGPNVEKIKALGFPVFKIKGIIHKYDPIAYIQLKKLIKKIKPDIIHSSLWSANFFGKLIANSLKIPILCDLHSNFSHDGKIRAFLERITANMAQKYIAISKTSYQGFINTIVNKIKNENKRKNLKSKILIIQNGIDVKKVRKQFFKNPLSKIELGFKKDDFIIGGVGRLEPIKSFDLLIKAFSIFVNKIQTDKKNIRLCIVGDGSQRKKLENLVKKLDLTNKVLFVGQRIDAQRFYHIFDCFVLSSISEGLSISLLEALCFGLPIITTHNSFNHDVIINNKNGFLIPIGDKNKLAQAIEKLYSSNLLCKKIKNENLKLVKAKFDIEKTKNAYQKAYSDMQIL